MPMIALRPVAMLLAAVAVLAATVTGAGAQTAVKFSLDSWIDGPTAPFLLARDKGYFKAAGLDVTISGTGNPVKPIERVADGGYQMGVADLNAVIRFNAANPTTPVTAIYVVYSKPPFAIIGSKLWKVNGPKDLEGKILGAPADDPAYALWPVFAAANGIDAGKVKVNTLDVAVRESMFAHEAVQAITGTTLTSLVELKTMGEDMADYAVMLMADHGVDLYGNAVIVNPAFARANPDAVKGFLKAFNTALKETIADPRLAVALVTAANPAAREAAELDRLQLAIEQNIVSDEVREIGLGAVKPERLSAAIDQLASGGGIPARPAADTVFDSSFLPAERRL